MNQDIKLTFIGFGNNLAQIYQIDSLNDTPIMQAIMNNNYCLFVKDTNIVASFARKKNSSSVKQQILDNLSIYFNDGNNSEVYITCPHCREDFVLDL